MFSWYYGMTAKADIPVWAHGLQWYISDDADPPPDSWPTDFGILMDFANVTRARRGCEKPFVWAKDLEIRLLQRWKQRLPPPLPFRNNRLLFPDCLRDLRIVRSPSRPPPAKIRQQSVDGIDPTLPDCMRGRRIVRSPSRPPPAKMRQQSVDGMGQPTKVCIVEGMSNRPIVYSPERPCLEKRRRLSSDGIGPIVYVSEAAASQLGLMRGSDESVIPVLDKNISGDLVEEDPMDAPEFYGFCGGGAWIPNTPEPGYRPVSTSPHRASSSSRMHVSTQRNVVCAEASSRFLPPDAMAYPTVPVWSSVCSLIGSGAPEVD